MKLSTRLTVAMVALVVLVAAGACAVVYRAFDTVLYPAHAAKLGVTARLLAEDIRIAATEASADVTALSRSRAIAGLLAAYRAGDATGEARWRETLDRYLLGLLSAKKTYLQIRVLEPSAAGREILRLDRSGAGGAPRIVPQDELQAKGDRPYFKLSLAANRDANYVSQIDLNQENGVIEVPHRPVLRVGRAVLAEDGSAAGVFIINVDMGTVLDQVRQGADPGSDVLVVNERGDYLVHPDRHREFGFDLGTAQRLQADLPALASSLRPETEDMGSNLRLRDRRGDEIAAGVASRRLGTDSWIAVVLAAPRAAIVAPVKEILFSTLVLGGIAIFAAILVAALLARSIARPLAKVSGAIRDIDAGKPVAFPDGSPPEVAPLIAALSLHIERERLFSAAVQGSADAILTKSPDGKITAYNQAAEKLYGYTSEEAIGMSIRRLVPDIALPEFETVQSRLRAGVPTEHYETTRVAKNGRLIDVSVSASPVRAVDGAIVGASDISRDVSARRRADALFRLAVNASPAGMIMVDQKGEILLASPEAERMFGYAADELSGRPVEILVPERLRAAHPGLRGGFSAHPSKRMMGTGRDLFGVRKDGKEFPVEVGLNPLDTSEGPLVLSVIVDITDRKIAEAERERQRAELQRSNAELQQFAYVASHDLQEPLRMVYSFCDLLKERYADKLDGDAREFIGFAADGAHRMRQLISDLLDYSRLQTRPSKLQPIELQAALDSALLNLERSIHEAEAEVTSDALPVVHGDLGQLSRLFQNLIGNAVKFRSRAKPRIHVSASVGTDEVVVSITDNGIGIAPKYAESIFGVFQRLHTRDEYPGTGIGLAVCKRIAQAHGGRIWVDSVLGEGSTFRFTLKAASLREAQPEASHNRPAANKEAELVHDGHR